MTTRRAVTVAVPRNAHAHTHTPDPGVSGWGWQGVGGSTLKNPLAPCRRDSGSHRRSSWITGRCSLSLSFAGCSLLQSNIMRKLLQLAGPGFGNPWRQETGKCNNEPKSYTTWKRAVPKEANVLLWKRRGRTILGREGGHTSRASSREGKK